MTGNPRIIPALRYMSLLVLLMMRQGSPAQQNNTLFFMHHLPEANFVNPAVQAECRIFLGLPVLSSVHVHVSNSGFTAAQLLKKQAGGSYEIAADQAVDKLGRRNLFTSEAYVTLLAAGLRRDNLYYNFTVTEKGNLALHYSRDFMAFALRGNTQFEGQWVDLRGTGLFFNYLREYAFGISKEYTDQLTLGIKVKLLFGKLNLIAGQGNMGLFTQENTFDLLFNGNTGFNSSLPYSIAQDGSGEYYFNHMYDASVRSYLFNMRNPGIAVDAGFIYRYSDRVTFSGSLLDLGLINYRSNLTRYRLSGNYLYQGPMTDSILTEDYLNDLVDGLNYNMDVDLSYNPYLYLLDPRVYLGMSYRLNSRNQFNLLWYNRFSPEGIQTAAMVSVTSRPLKNLGASISWSAMNQSLANLGVGFGYGRSPVQVYLVSDNIFGFLLPMNVKNVNLRFGLNLIFGCREELDLDQCGCAWLRDAEQHRSKKEEFKRGKKVRGN